MPLNWSFSERTFTFRFDARTSRGPIKSRRSWFLKVVDPKTPEKTGYGECAPLPGLSVEDISGLENVLAGVLEKAGGISLAGDILRQVQDVVPEGFPSITFGMETALLDLKNGGRRLIFDNGFARGNPIPINGLVWMADRASMLAQVDDLVDRGFSCIKIKVGGLDFEEECDMLGDIRRRYGHDAITLRLDANGAFDESDALSKLDRLSAFAVHSIEQPLKPGSKLLAELCARSPVRIALDEELIGQESVKRQLLETVRPPFIVLKPSLHGGIFHCREWISVAEHLGIGWWITSALESSIGLNAISQFTAGYEPVIHQGLGTGSIYTNNIPSPLRVSDGCLLSDPTATWGVAPDNEF